jgi:NAD dependent epimerase/dehydratase family enzyme
MLELLILQFALGAFDTLYHHEIKEQLPYRRGASAELRIHGIRALLYALIAVGLAWFEWRGALAAVVAAFFALEIALTLADFVVEDRTRKLPASERVTHTLLAVNGGAFLLALGGAAAEWWQQPSALTAADHGWRSTLLSVAALGVAASGLRDLHAARKLAAMARAPRVDFGARRLSVLVSGATGFIGRRVVWALLDAGHSVALHVRDGTRAWLLFEGRVTVFEALPAASSFDVIINLAGEPVVGLPWTRARRRRLLESRLGTTGELIDFISRSEPKPELFISASAIGYYGDRGDTPVTERDAGRGEFMSELCTAWERCAERALHFGVRVCIGSGRQWVSWVHVDDVVAAVAFLVRTGQARGPFNVVSPGALRQQEFAAAIARSYGRALWLALPAWLLERTLGEMARLFTRGQWVQPTRLCEAGFRFRFTRFDDALRNIKGTT